jgi:hypothetical protein
MKRQDIIRRVKDSNKIFFNRESRIYFGDKKHQWLTRDKLLIVTKRDDTTTIYTWDDNFDLSYKGRE